MNLELYKDEIEKGIDSILDYMKAKRRLVELFESGGVVKVPTRNTVSIIVKELCSIAFKEGNACDAFIEVIFDGDFTIRPKVYIEGEKDE